MIKYISNFRIFVKFKSNAKILYGGAKAPYFTINDVDKNVDYYVVESGGATRLGTVMAAWNSAGTSTTWTDTSTPDMNGSTEGIGFTVTATGGTVDFNSVVTSGTWTIKIAIRIIY